MSEEIIPVKSVPEVVDVVPDIVANGVVWVGRVHVVEEEGATVLSVVIHHASRNNVEVVYYLRERWSYIIVPISCTIAHYETLKRVGKSGVVDLEVAVMLVDLPCEVGDVDPSIALS